MISNHPIVRWIVAVAAVGYFGVMIITGRSPAHGRLNVADNGLIREPPAAVTSVEITKRDLTIALKRQRGDWVSGDGVVISPAAFGHLERGMQFMHTARPVRRLPTVQTSALNEYGLAPPRVSVRLANDVGVLLQFDLGGVAPDGILRYLRVNGAADLYLVSGFVGAAWDAVAADLFGRAPR